MLLAKKVSLGIGIAVFCIGLDASAANALLQPIQQFYSVPTSWSIWSIIIYHVCMAALLLPLSNMGEKYGFKYFFKAGIIGYFLGGIVCFYASTFFIFLIGRFLIALAAACILGSQVALVKLSSPKNKIGRYLGISAFVIALGFALGPTYAGYIVELLNFKWVYIIAIPLQILSFFILIDCLPNNTDMARKISGFESISVCLTLLFLLLGLFLLKDAQLMYFGISLLFISLVFLLLLYRKTKNKNYPIFPFDLIQNPAILQSLIPTLNLFCIQSVVYISLPLVLYQNYGYSLKVIGLCILPWPLVASLLAPLSGYLSDRFSATKLSLWGITQIGLGVCFLPFAISLNSVYLLLFGMVVCGFGFGLFQSPNIKSVMCIAPPQRNGAASALLALFRIIGQTLGGILVSFFTVSHFSENWPFVFYIAGALTLFGIGCLAFKLKAELRITDSI